MNHLSIFTRLFHDLSVYRELINQKLKSSLFRFLIYYLISSLAIGTWFIVNILPKISSIVSEYQLALTNTFADEAVIQINNGKLSTTGLSEPFTLPSPQIDIFEGPQNLLYLDSRADAVSLSSSSAWISLGSTTARLKSPDSDSSQIINYQEEGWQTNPEGIKGSDLRKGLEQLRQLIANRQLLIALIISLPILFGLIIARFIHAAIYALLFSLTGSLFNRKYSFAEFLNLTLHTILIADTINWTVMLVYGKTYPPVFTIAFIGSTLMAYFALPENLSKNS